MKKIAIIILAIVFLFSGVALAASYSVTMTWTPSTNAQLQNEKIFLDGVEQCDVLATATPTCNFTVPDLTGQEVTGQSFNTQGTGSDVYVFGTLLAKPEPMSDPVFIITYIP